MNELTGQMKQKAFNDLTVGGHMEQEHRDETQPWNTRYKCRMRTGHVRGPTKDYERRNLRLKL